jgi:hypothetical protein
LALCDRLQRIEDQSLISSSGIKTGKSDFYRLKIRDKTKQVPGFLFPSTFSEDSYRKMIKDGHGLTLERVVTLLRHSPLWSVEKLGEVKSLFDLMKCSNHFENIANIIRGTPAQPTAAELEHLFPLIHQRAVKSLEAPPCKTLLECFHRAIQDETIRQGRADKQHLPRNDAAALVDSWLGLMQTGQPQDPMVTLNLALASLRCAASEPHADDLKMAARRLFLLGLLHFCVAHAAVAQSDPNDPLLNVKASRLVVASVIAESSLQGDLHFRDRESPEACEPTAPLSGDEDDDEFEPEAYIPAHQEGLMPGRQKLAAQSEILTRIGAQVRRFTPGSVPRVINPAAIKVLLENEARIQGRHCPPPANHPTPATNVTKTIVASTRKRSGGLPLSRNAACAVAMPTPKR